MEDCRGELEERREVTRNANPIRTVMQVAHYAPNNIRIRAARRLNSTPLADASRRTILG